MEPILNWGVMIILWLQQFSPGMDALFHGFTFLGSEDFFMVLMPLLYWCIDRRTGGRLVILFLFSSYLGALFKVLLQQPRPFQYDPRVKMLTPESSYGLPSLHTQNTLVVWVYLASVFKRKWLWLLAGILLIMVPLSRIYLGVHFPTDVLGGYITGAGILLLGLWLIGPLEGWLGRLGMGWQMGLAALAAGVMALTFPGSDDTAISTSAMILGAGIGLVLERRSVGFSSGGLVWKQALRFALGFAVVMGLRYALKAAFTDLQPEEVFRFIRYALMGFWFTFGAPWSFVRLRLAEGRR